MYPHRICKECKAVFHTDGYKKKFCKKECRDAYYNRGLDTFQIFPKARNMIHRGAISELVVCVDLLGKGYDVYRSVSPAGRCDLVAIKDEKTTRVEVKTGHYSTNGKVLYGSVNGNLFDVLAVYLGDKVMYVPPLD